MKHHTLRPRCLATAIAGLVLIIAEKSILCILFIGSSNLLFKQEKLKFGYEKYSLVFTFT